MMFEKIPTIPLELCAEIDKTVINSTNIYDDLPNGIHVIFTTDQAK